jgi:hypothetical protein
MCTTPGRSFVSRATFDLDLILGWMTIEKLAVVCDPKAELFRLNFKGMCETEIAKLKMVAIGFAVSGNIDDWPGTSFRQKSLN